MVSDVLFLLIFAEQKKIKIMIELDSPKKTSKTFVLEKQETQQSQFIQSYIDSSTPSVDLSPILASHLPLSQNFVQIYDPTSNEFKLIDKIGTGNGIIPQHFVDPSFVLIKYRPKDHFLEEQSQMLNNDDQSIFRMSDNRSKERTIAEAIALVKHWRNLHLTAPKPTNPKKKMNLQEAAKEVGVSKKSLDDYYCQLRLAELHNYNFLDNMNEKMGRLRAYVKEHRVDQAARIRHHKHPKTLKIIEQFTIDSKMQLYIQQEKQQANQELERLKEESNHMEEDMPLLSPKIEPNMFNIENNFYENFQFLMDDPSDPFLFQNNRFRKKPFDSESEDFLF